MKTLHWVETVGYHLSNPLASVHTYGVSDHEEWLCILADCLSSAILWSTCSLTCSLFSSGLLGASLLKC